MSKKVFKSNMVSYIKYKLQEEKWLDKDTYLLVFQDMVDEDGEIYHLEVEYHVDEDKFTYTRVYEHENIDAVCFVSNTFKNQFIEYVLKQIGKINEDDIVTSSTIVLSLKVVLPPNMTMGEYSKWLNSLEINIADSGGVKILEIEKK